MDLPKVNFILGNVNALLGSASTYAADKQYGDRSGGAEMNLGANLFNGVVRNGIAYDMRRTTGSNMGFLVNNMAGYGNPESNYMGAVGLMGASMMNSPYGFYGGGMCGMSPFGYSTFGGSMFGGLYGGGGCGCGGGFGGGMFGGGYSMMGPQFMPPGANFYMAANGMFC